MLREAKEREENEKVKKKVHIGAGFLLAHPTQPFIACITHSGTFILFSRAKDTVGLAV
jgi:hypothetical protein